MVFEENAEVVYAGVYGTWGIPITEQAPWLFRGSI